jgi:hypothetical protein
MINEIIKIVESVKFKIHEGSNMGLTRYNNPKELRDELDGYIAQLKENDLSCLEELYGLFLPTCDLQDISIPNGWSDEYVRLAGEFDKIYYIYKGR